MRAVNAASRNLSTIIDSGWKAKQKGRSESSVAGYASAAKKGLDTLRELSPRELDVERAASAVVGKLVSLEMYDTAISILADMRNALIALYYADYQLSSKPPQFCAVYLPLVETEIPELILTLISTYLLHSITVYCQPKFDLAALADVLDSSPTLLAWTTQLTRLPEKQHDSVLTRSYTVIATCASSPGIAPRTAYRLRTYALLCLAHTRPSIIVSNTFWDQAVKFAAALVAGERGGEEDSQCEVAEHVLQSYERVVAAVQGRPDKTTFMSGTGFVAFCEYWIACAKEAGDMKALDRINGMIGGSEPAQAGREKFIVDGTKICATLAQALTVFDKWDDCASDRASRLHDTETAITRCGLFLSKRNDTDEKRTADKVRRALERLRRSAIKVLESSSPTEVQNSAKSVLENIIGVLAEAVHETHTLSTDTVTPALDTLFVLARTSMCVSNPDTYAYAFGCLARASMLVSGLSNNASSADAMGSCANYVRCVSGAFHHLAGVLYQASRYSHTVRFLNEGCVLGSRALEMYREARRGGSDARKQEDAWTQLEDQLYRRWELLGVCQAKTGDRKLAFDAFVMSIKTFPFSQPSFVQAVRTTPSGVFDTSSSLKQIASVLDRATYMGACDLFLEPDKLSTKVWLAETALSGGKGAQTWNCVIGTLLERQIESLESSRWKAGVRAMIDVLLRHALEVYSPTERPVRRARVLLKCLEHAYYAPAEGSASIAGLSPTEIAAEALELLSREDPSSDSGLVQYRTQYLATTHLYMALHTHRIAGENHAHVVVTNAEQAWQVLKKMISNVPRQSLAKIQSPRVIAAPKKKPAARAGASTRGGPTRTRIAKASARHNPPVTPKPRHALNDHPVNTALVTPPKPAVNHHKSAAVFDDFPKFFSLLVTTSHLVGLLGHVLVKIQLLNTARRLSEQHKGATSDEFIMASLELAHEYVKLGRARKAASVYNQALASVRSGEASPEVRVMFLLRYAEALAAAGNVLKSASAYCEALALSEDLAVDEKGMSTAQRVRLRVAVLERAAVAASIFSVMQYSRDDANTSLDGLLQSLRLWNRAIDTMARLHPTPPSKSTTEPSNPFEVAEPSRSSEQVAPRRSFQQRSSMDAVEWRIADGLMDTLLSLAQGYFTRGSPREAQYFAEQAYDLANSLKAPAMISRALARKGEILLHLGQLEEAHSALIQAADLVTDVAGTDAADVHRLRGHYNQLNAHHQDAQELYERSLAMLDELGKLFSAYDGVMSGARKSLGVSPRSPRNQSGQDALAPALLAVILRQQIGLLHDTGSEYKTLLERFASLPPTTETKAEHSALMAKLTLDDVYSRFRADMFLSSLAESAITIPMGMSTHRAITLTPATQDILGTLTTAEKMFWSDLVSISRRGNVPHVRSAAISLALIRTLQTSLGKGGTDAAVLAARLIDASTSITLHREMLEAVQHKFRDPLSFDDLRWPVVTPNGSPLPPPVQVRVRRHRGSLSFDDSDEESDGSTDESSLQDYWKEVQKKYQSAIFDAPSMSAPRVRLLPANWTVVNITVTEDKSTMFVTRQKASQSPLIFCLPLKGRRENQDDEHLAFDDAIGELKEIIRLSDEGTKGAANIKKDDKSARAAWWADRTALDKRLQELLDNIEFCWLGAFKTILSQSMNMTPDDIATLRTRLDKVFERSLVLQDKKQKTRVRLDDALTECFAELPPHCRDEELEDLVYFVLDLYQFHGVPVAIAEVDVDQVCVDLRSALEEQAARLRSRGPAGATGHNDAHTFLVLDKNVQGIPWESLPVLRGKSVSRIPSMEFLLDRTELARRQTSPEAWKGDEAKVDRAVVDPRKTYYVLNPSGDLKNTEARFSPWLRGMKAVGWNGVVGRAPSEQQLVDALTRNDLVIYFGHGGAEQYVRSHKIRHLPRCAATMLWGCSSGALKEMGDFDRVGTPYNYMLAGCPTLVANLWDVTDRDIDKFSQAVFDSLRLIPSEVNRWRPNETVDAGSARDGVSAVTAVAKARECCKLKYLTGAAPVVYGIPFYL
ncbi:peptidase family C50-domain-containing protein [Sparassis latifolia]